MEFEALLSIVGAAPVFETGLLLAGEKSPNYIRRQLSGWVNAGRVWQLRRGLYTLAPPFQKTTPHPFHVANRMVAGSYVSLQAALAYYGLIPEYVPTITSVTTQRPAEWDTLIGHFTYRHIRTDLLFGYQYIEVGSGQYAFVATPEKALLDLIYLQPGGAEQAYLKSLRLQNLDQFNLDELHRIAAEIGKPKVLRAVAILEVLVTEEAGYVTL